MFVKRRGAEGCGKDLLHEMIVNGLGWMGVGNSPPFASQAYNEHYLELS